MLQSLLNTLNTKIPDHLSGMDRQEAIGNLIDTLPPEQLKVLREQMNSFLKYMRDQGASDIEVGGTTAKNRIWLRIQGKKEIIPSLGEWPLENTDLLLHSLITSTQRRSGTITPRDAR